MGLRAVSAGLMDGTTINLTHTHTHTQAASCLSVIIDKEHTRRNFSVKEELHQTVQLCLVFAANQEGALKDQLGKQTACSLNSVFINNASERQVFPHADASLFTS